MSHQLLNARVELGIGRTDRALSITLGLLRADSSNVAAYCVRAEALFVCEEFNNATRLLKQALRMDPDNAGAKLAFRRAKNMQQQMVHGAHAPPLPHTDTQTRARAPPPIVW